MFLKKYILISFVLFDLCASWLNERPILEASEGNLYISGAKDKNITLKTFGSGNININEINLFQVLWAAQNASRLIERWKSGILDDIETTILHLNHIVEGPTGLIRKINLLEQAIYISSNTSRLIKSSIENETSATPFTSLQMSTINNKLRRLENKVRTIITNLRKNNCLSDPCQNGGTCINSYDSFQCQCLPEWEGILCTVDVNECERFLGKSHGCQNGATCINFSGGFKCVCAIGWHGFHCSISTSVCDQSNNLELCGYGVCIKTNSPLGYTCICTAGWDHLGESDPSCRKDIDECTMGRYPCSINPLVKCHNIPGSFYCGVCPSGYSGDGFSCQDIDECLINNGGCSTSPQVECINTFGSRKCSLCPNGYQGDGASCFYVGSCSISNGGCNNLASCSEGPNSQPLCVCPPGYEGSGKGPNGCKLSEDVCRSNPCINGTCNSHGVNNFSCSCNEGYTGPTCNVSTNPCTPNPCKNNGLCRISIKGKQFCECTASFTGSTCSKNTQACGGFFKNSFGKIEFPVGTGSKYDHGLSCAWVILTNQSLVLNLTFTKFALEDSHGSDECKHDYIQIHDGRSAGSNIYGRYCGNLLPNNGTIISTHNSLYIWFHSDSTVNSDGFIFNWISIKPICGGSIYEDYGSISSPGFPGKYPPNRDCYWNVDVSPGKRITLQFLSLMLEQHSSCKYDYLEVNETNYAGQYQLGIFCNHSKPAPITTSGSHVDIHFHSDTSGSDSGFHLSFISIAGSPDCGGIYTSESGEIISPGYHSGSYHSGLICDWEIRLPEKSSIHIKWLNFDVESSRNCIFDSVKIYVGPNANSPLVGRYCGSNLPPPISVVSSRILIRFVSDLNLQEKGFIMKYEVECGGKFTEPSGTLKSPYYPNFYPASKECIYLISQPPGKAIILTFEFMDIEEGTAIYNKSECYFDGLEIRDGDTENATLLCTLCGSIDHIPTQPIYSTHNYLFIKFFTDASTNNYGFKANYTTIDRACGGIFKNAPGTIIIPGINKFELANVNACIWTIHAPPNYAIQLTWISFFNHETSTNEECVENYVEIVEDFSSSNSKSLGKYCSVKIPQQVITSQGNDLSICYHFIGDILDIDYQVSYIFVNNTFNCGGHYYSESGYIKSPNYPKQYPRNKECIWTIETKNKFLITIDFTNFKLENSSNCASDYLEIRSGSQESAPLLGRFCGSQVEDELTSLTNQMRLKFVSDSSVQNQGFEINWRSTKAGCGGNLRASSGAIISPNYPQNYYHRAICLWNIRVSAGSIIQITFIDFDLEDHLKCSFDYLEISDVIKGFKKNNKRFCGSVIPPNMLSTSNQIRLSFRSDVLDSFRGFHLRYTTVCNNKLRGFDGVIESPNFPRNYEYLSNCSWIISAPAGNRINITFSHFNVYGNIEAGCKENFVRIQEGDNDEPNTEIIKKCGSAEDILPLKISSSQRQIFVSFSSDRNIVASGFRLEWYIDGCTKRFTKPTGQIVSPGFPNPGKLLYSYIECEWLIEVDFDYSIEIIFSKIATTRTHTCQAESVGSITIFNGQTKNAPILVDSLCYSNVPITITGTGNRMLIKYSSDINYASHGFTAKYHSVSGKCGGKFIGQTGVIHSANYPNNYPHNQNCQWLIIVDENHVVNLTFIELDIEKSRNCSDDYIKIYDGNLTEAPLLGVHCQSIENLPYYVSSGNKILVTMRTDSLASAKGFKAYYNRTCGARIIVDGQGLLRSSSTLHTISSLNCSWILTAKDSDDQVTLIFNHIDFLLLEDCSSNHIEIYEGETINGLRLGQICTNKIPPPFYSTGNSLTIHLTSHYGLVVGDNFEATYSTFNSVCGGKYTTESGIIASPNYPLSYASATDCTWILNTSAGNRISLTFDYFELLDSENCDIDYLEIRENSGLGKLRGIFCGKIVESITSSQSLWIRFRSALNTVGNPKGFLAEYHLLFGDELSGDFGEIASPLYPLPYRKSETFSWRITVDVSYVIKIEFLDFSMENYDEYCYSYLKIYDGYDDEAPQIQELCGISIPQNLLLSTSNVIFIKMENSFDHVGNWFHLKWIKIPRSEKNGQMEEFKSSDSSKIIFLSEQNKSVTFNSPGYPDGYKNNLQYSWTFVSPSGTHLLLRFLTMDIEESQDCLTDYVSISNGYIGSSDTNVNIKKICLSNSTMTTFPGSNVMSVQFVTDSFRNRTGFSAIILTECGGNIEDSNGIIEVNNTLQLLKPRPYIFSCEWTIRVKTGRRIHVNVTLNLIENKQHQSNDNSCRSNYLMLKNGASSSSPLLGIGKYCNGAIPPVQNTSSNFLYVKLSVFYATVNFKLVFNELGHDCGGTYHISNKMHSKIEITSPNYPNIPSPHTECFWIFMSIDEHSLAIHFVDRFDLAFSENCEQEYIEIRDGATDMSSLLGRYCNIIPPSSLTTKSNTMYVHYFTNIPEPHNGFKAVITTDVCGGIERKVHGGSIKSPNYPDSYDIKTQICSWWIIAPLTGRRIKLKFQDIQLPDQQNCTNTDHLEIYEKIPGNYNSTKVGTYCGKNKPDVLDILTSEASIIFRTSLFTNAVLSFTRRFRLDYTFHQDGCSDTFIGMSGEFQTIGYPRSTPYKFCRWKIIVPEGYQVVLDLIDLDFGIDKHSKSNHVSFHHDPDSITTILQLRESKIIRILSSSNFMGIYYISGESRGMKAKYFALAPAPCGSLLTNFEGSFTNPSFAPFNESSFYCKWKILQPDLESNNNTEMSLSITLSGIINKGKGSLSCRDYLTYVIIKGDEIVAKICGNFSKNFITIVSPFKMYTIKALNATYLAAVNFTIKYKWYKCGGILVGSLHTIQAPKNISYPAYCAWKVKAPNTDDGFIIRFEKINLGSCENAHVQIKGKTYQSPVLGKFCGNEKPQQIESSTSEIMIEYYAANNYADFVIQLSPANYACGGTVKGKRSEIRSPGFPKGYPNNTECIWEIVANSGYHIGLSFIERFNLETSKDCQNDFVEIYEWNELTQNNKNGWKKIIRLCGRTPSKNSFNSTTNKMLVKFVSNDKLEGEGFKAIWYPNCGGIYEVSDIPKYIESPNFPFLYPLNIFCNYTLLVQNDQEIIIDFTNFSLEENSASCSYDNVTITFFNGKWIRGKSVWCGSNSPGKKMSKGRMELIFRTDGSVNRAGFKFKYTLNDCGGIITTQKMINPTVDSDPDSYGYMHCLWLVKAPAKKSVVIRFEKLNILQTVGSCTSNFVKVYEGNSTSTENQKATFCGNLNSNLPVLQSITDMMTIIFHINIYGEQNHSLQAAILFVNSPEIGCGGNINVTTTTLFKTQLTEKYDPFQDCNWQISAQQGYSIILTINEIDLKITSSNDTLKKENMICYSDYIEVRDGGPYAKLIGQYCGNVVPPPIISTNNLLWVRFVSDGLNQGFGAKGILTKFSSPCGVKDLAIANDSQILTSPQYPNSYPSNINCRWIIHIQSSIMKRIRIIFKDFNLEDSEYCENEYVQIADLNTRKTISEGFGENLIVGGTKLSQHSIIEASRVAQSYYKYCGSNVPHEYFSNFDDIEITYKASSKQIKNKGFKLEYSKASCSHNYTSLQGRIVHDNIVDCWIVIEVPENFTINMYFNYFFLPGSNDCSKANMQIRDGDFQGHIIQTVCNFAIPNPVFSKSNRISFHAFNSRIGHNNNNGYDITYTSTSNGRGCGGQIFNYGGVFTSPLYPSPYRNRTTCVWDVSVPKGTKISLHFSIFDIGSINTCDTDYLTISEIESNGSERVIDTYCGGDSPADLNSRRNRVIIKYTTSLNNGGSGWIIKFKSD